ncbi:hypothetical protein DPMN_111503 [Dreissena polymorpha]|uniref:Uncharacterized protein n=1 Tax=Dreissena polymorpha TaxID=45954 RepID=A0A9D4QPU9_DREPO|nr:hypothetical protein DPMN_111503 [Dreissena polymorpha]
MPRKQQLPSRFCPELVHLCTLIPRTVRLNSLISAATCAVSYMYIVRIIHVPMVGVVVVEIMVFNLKASKKVKLKQQGFTLRLLS